MRHRADCAHSSSDHNATRATRPHPRSTEHGTRSIRATHLALLDLLLTMQRTDGVHFVLAQASILPVRACAGNRSGRVALTDPRSADVIEPPLVRSKSNSHTGTFSRTYGKRCPLAFEEQIYPQSRAHSAPRRRAREHHDFDPSLRPESSLVEPTSPDRRHTRSRDQSKEARQGGTGRSDRRSGILRREVVRAHQVVFGSSRNAGTCSSDRLVPVSELPRRGVAARHRSSQTIVGENASGVHCQHV